MSRKHGHSKELHYGQFAVIGSFLADDGAKWPKVLATSNYPVFFIATNSFSSAGFACPFDSRITCPTKNCRHRLLSSAILLHLLRIRR